MTSVYQGWAVLRNGTCTNGKEVDCGVTQKPFRTCCPTGYQCYQNNVACCLPGNNCTNALIAKPGCANSGWNLFSNGGSYFCCDDDASGWSSGNSNGCTMVPTNLNKQQTLLSTVQWDRTSTFNEQPSFQDSKSGTVANKEFTEPTDSSTGKADKSKSHSSTPVGAIVGGVIAGLVLLALLCVLALFLLRRRRRAKEKEEKAYVSNPTALEAANETTDQPRSPVKYGNDAGPSSPSRPLHEADGNPMPIDNARELPAPAVGSEERPAELSSETVSRQ